MFAPALAAVLVLQAASPVQAKVPTRIPDDAVRGRDLYEAHCWQCHGPAGQGDGPVARVLTAPVPALDGLDDGEVAVDQAVATILAGAGDMPAYAAVLNEPDTRRILVWLESLDADKVKVKPRRKIREDEDREGEIREDEGDDEPDDRSGSGPSDAPEPPGSADPDAAADEE